MKYGLYYYKNTHNIGDDVWAYAQSLFYPHIDYLIDNTTVYKFKSKNNEDVATIIGAFVEPYNNEYCFMPPSNIIPFFSGAYFRPTMWELLQKNEIIEYLKAFQPIGCRTVEQADNFRRIGVEAFFSGCITLTLPDLKKPKGEYICCVDVPEYIVEYVCNKVNGRFEIKTMSHDINNIAEHSSLDIEKRFDIVKGNIDIYASAHCVITSRLHVALPCLTQNTPVLMTVTDENKIGANDIHSRLKDFFSMLHHNFHSDFQHNNVDYDFLFPPRNPDNYLTYRNKLITECFDFIRNCEGGFVENRCTVSDSRRTEQFIDILQEKVRQLKSIVDSKNTALSANPKERILKLQQRLRKYETFNEWENVEYFSDWSERSQVMSNLIDENCHSLLDLGCGEMHIRNFISPNVKYYGCDYKRRNADTIICDLAIGEFPEIHVDTIFIAGLLEYLGNWKEVLVKCSGYCRQIIMSYSTTEVAEVRDTIWVNNASRGEIVKLLSSHGFELVETTEFRSSEIFNFKKMWRNYYDTETNARCH